MRPEEFRDFLRREPFEPFRIMLTGGLTYDVHHPEVALLGRSVVTLGLAPPGESFPINDRIVTLSLLHIMQIEPLHSVTS